MSRRYTDLELACAVAESHSMFELLPKLGLVPRGGNYETIRRRIKALDLSTAHWGRDQRINAHPIWTVSDSVLRGAVSSSVSKSEALRACGLKSAPHDIRAISRRLQADRIDTSHFDQYDCHRRQASGGVKAAKLDEILVKGRPYQSSRLRRRLIKEGLKEERCEDCGLTEWRGRPIALELDHVNGLRDDNRLENIRLLCPNCHSLTDTYRGRNIGRMH